MSTQAMRGYKKNGTGPGGDIGLGLASSFKPKKIKRDVVVLAAQPSAQASTD